jgi:hypothetical protein
MSNDKDVAAITEFEQVEMRFSTAAIMLSMFALSTTTPFGKPVDPEVYIIYIGKEGSRDISHSG